SRLLSITFTFLINLSQCKPLFQPQCDNYYNKCQYKRRPTLGSWSPASVSHPEYLPSRIRRNIKPSTSIKRKSNGPKSVSISLFPTSYSQLDNYYHLPRLVQCITNSHNQFYYRWS